MSKIKKEKYTDTQVAEIVDQEGLSYAIQHYMSEDSIENPKLAKLWKRACDALNAIEKHLDGKLEY